MYGIIRRNAVKLSDHLSINPQSHFLVAASVFVILMALSIPVLKIRVKPSYVQEETQTDLETSA